MYRYNYKNQTTLQSHVLSSLHTPFTPPCTRHKMESTGKATRPRTVSKTKGLIEESFSRETTHFPLTDRQTDRLAAFVRLGLSMPLPHSIKTCECGKPLDSIPTGYHLLTCKTGGGPVLTHNTIVSTWSDCLNQIHLPNKVEPRDRYCSSDARPVIAICSNVFDSNVDLDVSLAHPWCSDIISKAAWQDGAAALRREEKKIEKYQKETRPGGFSPNLIPLVFEHYGRWGTEAEKFLNKISHRSRDEDSKSNTADFKTYWRRLFSVTLQNCNSSVIQRKIDHLTLGSSLLCALYQGQSHLH